MEHLALQETVTVPQTATHARARVSFRIAIAIALGGVALCSCAKTANEPSDPTAIERSGAEDPARAVVERVRTLAFGRDYAAAATEAAAALDRGVTSSRLQAWGVVVAARAGQDTQARTWLGTMDPDDPWTAFARAGVAHHAGDEDADRLTKVALQKLDAHPDAVWMRASELARQGDPHARDALPDVQTLADPVRAEVELLIAEARAGANWSYDKDDPQGLDVALAIAAEVRKRSPRTINAYYRPTRWLLRARRPDAARELVQRGIELAPHLDPLVELYWDAILSSNAFSPEQRRAAIRPEIERRLQARPGDPDLLFTAATYYGRLGLDDERERLFERIERDFSGSRAEESVAWARIDAQSELVSEQSRDQDETDPKARQELADMYRAMIARPRHHLTRWVGRAYTGLFMALRSQDDVDSDELLRLVEGMVEHDPHNPHIKYGMGPRMLAEKTDHDERALEIVELGLAEANAELAEAEDAAGKKPAKGSRARAESARKRLGFLLMEKAGVLAAMERFDEAQAALDAAEPHLGPYAERLLRAGQLAERRGRLDEAERCYADGLALPWHGETHPCREALQALYVERNGSERGLRRYMKRVEAEQRARRKADVLAERIEETRPMSAFSLTDLGGERLDSRDLAGKIAVVHFWSLWCGWCLAETPRWAEFVRRYANDPDVVVVTISGDGSADEVRAWLNENGYGIPMWMGGSWALDEAGVRSWPTTWFVDRDGNIRFEQSGATGSLIEEFTWRVDALR